MHHTKQKGDIGLTIVIAHLTWSGYCVSTPFSEHVPFDLIVVDENYENPKRIQIKYRSLDKKNQLTLQLSNHYNYNETNYQIKHDFTKFDAYAIYCPENNKTYYINCSEIDKSLKAISISINFPKNFNINRCRLGYVYENPERLFVENIDEYNEIKKQEYLKKTNISCIPKKGFKGDGKFTKEELEKLVWSKPITKIAKELGVSDVAIHKRCQRLGVEKPPPGYWTTHTY